MNVLNSFSNLKISSKLCIGFGLILLAILAIGASGLMVRNNIEDKATKSSLSVDIVNSPTAARLGRTNYQFTGDKQYLQQTESALTETGKIIDQPELFSWASEGRQNLSDMESQVNDFNTAMLPFLAALEKRQHHGRLLDSKTLYKTSMRADGLSRSAATPPAERIETPRWLLRLTTSTPC